MGDKTTKRRKYEKTNNRNKHCCIHYSCTNNKYYRLCRLACYINILPIQLAFSLSSINQRNPHHGSITHNNGCNRDCIRNRGHIK